MLTNLVAGNRGEVGSALCNILKKQFPDTLGFDKGETVVFDSPDQLAERYNVRYLHICIGWSEEFIDIVIKFVLKYKTKMVVVHSTVPIGTCRELQEKCSEATDRCPTVAHSPIRGMHPDMEPGIRKFVKYISCDKSMDAIELGAMFQMAGIETQLMASFEETEIAKLTSTLRRAMAIGVVQYIQRICDEYGADFDRVYSWWETTYNQGYKELRMPETVRPILFPGVIEKHCLMPNAEILQEQHPSKFIEALLESNELRKKEVAETKGDV